MTEIILPEWPSSFVKAGTLTRPLLSKLEGLEETEVPLMQVKSYLAEHYGLSDAVSLQQVHGHQALIVDDHLSLSESITGDALITRKNNVALLVKTADCLPIVLTDLSGIVAVVHAGWRGLLSGVIQNTIRAMNVPALSLFAWMGPGICVDHFVVRQDMRRSFEKILPHLGEPFFYKTDHKDESFCDLSEIARFILEEQGVDQISSTTICSYREPDLCYSYRRNPQEKKRLITFVGMAE